MPHITYFPLTACIVNALKCNRQGRECGGNYFKWWMKLTIIKIKSEDVRQLIGFHA
jgi:hypothetical protein